MKLKEFAALLILAALWGASFLFIRIASPALGPFLTVEGRVAIASIALLIYIGFLRRSTGFKERWRQYLIVGTLNAAIPFMLISTAALHLDASMSAILNSMTPLFTALIVSKWMKEKLTSKKWIGIFVGIMGVVILVGWSPIHFTTEVLIAVGVAILSTVFYGIGSVYAKKTFEGVPALSLAFGQQMGAAIVLFPITLFYLPTSTAPLTSGVIFSALALALFCTAIAYLLYFYLLANVGPTKTLSVTFLVPLFGMIWGVVFLHEKITFGMISGLIVILSSIFLISDIQFIKSKRPRSRNESPANKKRAY